MNGYNIVVVGGTPAGIGAAIAAARLGSRVALCEASAHIGGLMSSGLGRTDINRKNALGGIFKEYIGRIYDYYRNTYGPDSEQVRECNLGFWFEPSVAEYILNEMVAAEPNITLLLHHRLARVETEPAGDAQRVVAVEMEHLDGGEPVRLQAYVFIDASYEGDLCAWAGAPYRIGRESRDEYNEPLAGVVYTSYRTKEVFPGSTGEGDHRVQAYNFRLCLTQRDDNRLPIPQPEGYDRNIYTSLIGDVAAARITRLKDVLNALPIPNGKTDANNHHYSMLSSDWPEENYDYPAASYQRRAEIIESHRRYTLGLLYFIQNDPELPDWFRAETSTWGLAADEFPESGGFPRQIYVREARRIMGDYLFTAHDAMQSPGTQRAPVHRDSIAVGDYAIDSHATRKREPEHPEALEGFLGLGHLTVPYQLPYRIMLPQKIEAVLNPVTVSATHMGLGTIRMEPVWMQLGQAAGTAAHLACQAGVTPRAINRLELHRTLLHAGQMITYFDDLPEDPEAAAAVQFWGTRGCFCGYQAEPDAPLTHAVAVRWLLHLLVDAGIKHDPTVSPTGGLAYRDLPPDSRDYQAVLSLHRHGIQTGGDSAFEPHAAIALQRWQEWLNQAAQRLGVAPVIATVTTRAAACVELYRLYLKAKRLE